MNIFYLSYYLYYISLNKSSKEWAKIITEEIVYTRINMKEIIVKSGYDIDNEAIKLKNKVFMWGIINEIKYRFSNSYF